MSELKKSPLHVRHESLGAKFAEFGGWSMPLQYAGIVSEHKAVRDGVGIFDVSHLGKARIKGGKMDDPMLNLGAGFDAAFGQSVKLGLSYVGSFNSDITSNGVAVNFRVEF